LVIDLTAEGARSAAPKIIGELGAKPDRPLLLVRVNALGSGRTDDDLAAVMPARPDGIVLPGTIGGRDVAHLGAKLAVHEAEHGIADGATRILALAAESASAVLALPSLAGASPRLVALAFDPGPLAADLGADLGSEPVRHAGAMLVLAARAAGVAAIQGPSSLPYGPNGLVGACRAARSEGFRGKLARDPEEVAIIKAAFA
jgi:citrate lyase subunit beta/citryl-CoA lyase